MKSIYYDTATGNLKEGVVWEASWGYGQQTRELDLVYAKISATRGLALFPVCFRGADHERDVRVDSIRVDLFGRTLSHFVDVIDHGFTTISEEFATSLVASGLRGFSIEDRVKVAVNQSGVKDPRLLLLKIIGKGGFCHRYKVQGGENVCPNCRRTEVICAYCGQIESVCQSCGFTLFAESPKDRNANIFERHDKKPEFLIVANRDWDGSDIFGVGGPGGGAFCSTRAKDWFETKHVLQIKFKRTLIDMAP